MSDDTQRTPSATRDPALFSSAPPAEDIGFTRGLMIGRYVMLSKLGMGGMGIVFAAYDPELDRKVALKLLLPREGGSDAQGRSRLLREAQALAKLSHPNVVAIHDVGTHGARVWLAMEYVAGVTLREWVQLRPRRWSECLDVLCGVARGMIAAHAAGLVHRDLKPDNVMVDNDGRIRVMDFGLAHGRAGSAMLGLAATLTPDRSDRPEVAALALRLTRDDALQGTPDYMAPEQWQGQDVRAPADQFSWSVMAWELLYGERPFAGDSGMALALRVIEGRRNTPPRGRKIPGWLRRIIERGLAVDPSQRWPTMADLFNALEGERRSRRRLLMALALISVGMLGAGVAVAATSRTDRATEMCSGGEHQIADIWGPAQRAELHDDFFATNLSFVKTTWPYVANGLDRWGARWSAAHREVCEATRIRGEQSEQLMDAKITCLSLRLLDFRALIDSLESPDRTVVQRAPSAVDSLPRLDRCNDALFVLAQVKPPDDPEVERRVEALQAAIAEARSDWQTGRYARGLERASAAEREARVIAHGPAIAEAALVLGLLQDISGDHPAAERSLRAAFFDGLRYGLDEVSARASALLITVVGFKLARVDDARAWVDLASALIDHIGGDDLRSYLHLGRALLHDQRGEFDEALAAYQDALAVAERDPESGPHRAAKVHGNMAIVYLNMGDIDAAARHLERCIEGLTAILGETHPDIGRSWNTLGMVERKRGRIEAGRAAYERAVTIYEAANGTDAFDLATPLHNLANIELDQKQYPRAIEAYLRAIAIEENHAGPDTVSLAYSLTGLSQAELESGDTEAALAHARRALELRTHGDCTPSELAFAKFAVAAAGLARGSEDQEAMLALAREAEATFVEGGAGTGRELDAVRELLVKHAG